MRWGGLTLEDTALAKHLSLWSLDWFLFNFQCFLLLLKYKTQELWFLCAVSCVRACASLIHYSVIFPVGGLTRSVKNGFWGWISKAEMCGLHFHHWLILSNRTNVFKKNTNSKYFRRIHSTQKWDLRRYWQTNAKHLCLLISLLVVCLHLQVEEWSWIMLEMYKMGYWIKMYTII